MNLLHLGGNQIINLEHLVRAVYTGPNPGGEERTDEYTGQTYKTSPTPATLELTLTALELEDTSADLRSGYYLAAASRSQVVRLRGQDADDTWRWLEEFAQPANIIPA